MRIDHRMLAGLAAAAFTALPAGAQLKWDGCADLSASQLRKVPLVSRNGNGAVPGTTATDPGLNEPVKLAVAANGDVYIAERGGTIKLWRKGTVKSIGSLPVFTGGSLPHPSQKSNENGLHGIVLAPDFETTRHIYLHFAPPSPSVIRIARFTLNGDALDASSAKTLLDIPVQRNSCCHTGGGMEFDVQGNLFITVGNNTTNPGANAPDAYLKESDPDADDQGHAANTNDLRGKVLRIKPKADGSYEVPTGNLFPKGTDKARPEIWAMGVRNPYSLTVDRYRGWAGWGDIGPDDGLSYSEEWNLYTRPVNAGWPYFTGPNRLWRQGFSKDPAAPVNNSPNNTGLKTLPPAAPALIGYQQSCAVTGPIHYYDGANPSRTMLPPHVNGRWLVSDWWRGQIEAVELSGDGSSVVSRSTLMPPGTLNGPLDFKFGPEGALYVVEYGQTSGGLWFAANNSTQISRIDYTGTCHPATPVPPTPTALDSRDGQRMDRAVQFLPGSSGQVAMPGGAVGFRLYDLRGRLAWEYRASGAAPSQVAVPAHIAGHGILRIRFLF